MCPGDKLGDTRDLGMRDLEARKAQEHAGRTPGVATKLPWDLKVRGAGGGGSCHPAVRWQREPRAVGGWERPAAAVCELLLSVWP